MSTKPTTGERKLTSREAARELFVAGYLQALDEVADALAMHEGARAEREGDTVHLLASQEMKTAEAQPG